MAINSSRGPAYQKGGPYQYRRSAPYGYYNNPQNDLSGGVGGVVQTMHSCVDQLKSFGEAVRMSLNFAG
eukprot:12428495-Karenia_brevis.AAC.1